MLGSNNTGFRKPVFRTKIKYKYPRNLPLIPGEERHDKLVELVLSQAKYSYNKMQKRHKEWRKIDQNLTGYIPLDEEERRVKGDDPRKPVQIVVPMSFYTQDTFLMYYTAEFLHYPIFEYTGVDPSDYFKGYLLQEIVKMDSFYGDAILKLFIFFKDITRYGFGALAVDWRTREKKVNGDWELIEDGNRFYNIDPYLYLPDPDVSIDNISEGNFVGFFELTNYYNLLSEEGGDPNGDTFNVKYLENMNGLSNIYRKGSSGRTVKYETLNRRDYRNMPVDVINMWCYLIPKDWGLGKNTYPEWWLISVAADSVVIRCRPMDKTRYDIPIVVGAPDTDGYSIYPLSRIELDYGLQEAVDHLMSSHIANVRKAVNDMFIVDPNRINMNDLLNPKPGKIIRLKSDAWGQGIDGAIKQLSVADVTRANIGDISNILNINSRFSGASDSVSGHWRQGSERVSATEAQGTFKSALSRLERVANIVAHQAINPLAMIVAENVQRFLAHEVWVGLSDEWKTMFQTIYGDDKVLVERDDINIPYDIVPKKVSSSEMFSQNPQAFVQMLQIGAEIPEIMGQYNIAALYGEMLKNMGIKNIKDFAKRPVQIQPQEQGQIEKQAQSGNIVPIQQGA